MSWHIWFVPTNSSHVGKLKAFMDALAAAGHRVHLLSIDAFLAAHHAALPHIEKAGYPYEVMPGGGFRPHRRRTIEALRRRKVVRAVEDFFANRAADAVIFGEDYYVPTRTFIRTLLRLEIPTVLVADGITLPSDPYYEGGWWNAVHVAAWGLLRRALRTEGARGTSGVDRILVMNRTGLEVLVEHGARPDRIRVVGSCEYDALASHSTEPFSAEEEQRLRARLALPPDRPVVFFAHQGIGGTDVERAVVRTMVAGARRCGATVLVKFHPRVPGDPEAWRAWARAQQIRAEEAVFARDECTSLEAVRLCSVCVAAFSTIILEAMIYRKPVVLVQYLKVPCRVSYGRQYGAALEAETPAALEEAIVSAVTDPQVRERLRQGAATALQNELHGLDGRSAERMVESVTELIRERQAASTARL